MGRRGNYRKPTFEAQHSYEYCKKNKLCAECGKKLEGRRTRWCGDECVTKHLIRNDPKVARRMVKERDKGVCASCEIDTTWIRGEMREADKKGIAEYLDWWNKKNPRGIRQCMSEPDKFAHLGYDRYMGPRVYCGYNPGGGWSANKKRRGTARLCEVSEFVKIQRMSRLRQLGLQRFLAWWWRKTFWDMDHIRPIARGGGGCDLDNLRTLCVPCHSERSAKETRVRSQGGMRRITRRPNEKCERSFPCRMPNLCGPCRVYRKRAKEMLKK